jgi:hypothetical protein
MFSAMMYDGPTTCMFDSFDRAAQALTTCESESFFISALRRLVYCATR